MGFSPKIKVQLIKCGTCGKSYNNPLTHTCVIRLDGAAKKTAAARKAAAKKKK